MTLEAIHYKRGSLSILDQLLLPLESKYIELHDVKDGWDAIHNMKVRGAPAIAIVGCLSLAKEIHDTQFVTKGELHDAICRHMTFLITSRPTAVNMKQAADQFTTMAKTLMGQDVTLEDMKEKCELC